VTHYLISFGDYVLDVVAEVQEGGKYPPDHVLEPIDAMVQFGYCFVVENVRAQELIEGIWLCSLKTSSAIRRAQTSFSSSGI
jgi:hypothetical protein